ncbi:MAG: OmpA family protein [Bacteroidales bacterium]|nr:OmpA family protein [Bacteroidales bacterium]
MFRWIGFANVLFFLLMISNLFSQNLVPNPGFEDKKGNRYVFKPWQKVNTIDFYVNAPGVKIKDVNPYKNYKTYILRDARTGYAYAGLRVWPKYHEFLIVPLKEPLKPNKAYSFEMYVTPSRYANCYLKTIGASFYPTKVNYLSWKAAEDYPPQIHIYMPHGIRQTDTSEWIRINGVFIAEGGERYMTIGCFTKQNRKKLVRKYFSLKRRDAYYYIDDIALYELDERGLPILEKQEQTKMNDDSLLSLEEKTISLEDTLSSFSLLFANKNELPHELKEIYFEENAYKLLPDNYAKLSIVVEFLLENPNYIIEIRGFAAPGEANGKENQLSEKRVKSVSHFLNGNRIALSRIIEKPMGVQCPFSKINQPERKFCRKVLINLYPKNSQKLPP